MASPFISFYNTERGGARRNRASNLSSRQIYSLENPIPGGAVSSLVSETKLKQDKSEKLSEKHEKKQLLLYNILDLKDSETDVTDSEKSEEIGCKICFEYYPKVVFIPCGHFICCRRCSIGMVDLDDIEKKVECPLCKQEILQMFPCYSG